MTIRSFIFSPRAIVVALAFSLGVAANGFAMPRGEPGGPGFGMHGHHAVQGIKAMQRMHDELKLDAKQEAAWQEAEKFAKDNFDGARETIRKQHEEIKSMLDKPGADLRSVVKRMDEFKAEGRKQHEVVRDRWLTVYDTLNAEQKEKVRLFFKAGAERRGHFMEHRGRGVHQQPAANPPAK